MSAAAAIMEEIHASGCNGAACHAQMYIMGTLLRHGSAEQKAALPAEDRRAASCACRRSASPSRPRGTDTLSAAHHRGARRQRHYVVNGQKIWTSRAEHSDLMLLLARTTPREQVKKRTEGLSVFLVDMRARGQGPHHQADPHHDEPRHHRSVLRRHASAGGEPDRRGGQGLPLHPVRHERRAHPDRRRMHRRRQMVHREGDAPTPRSAACSAGRSGRTRACSSRSRAPTRRCAPPS